MHLCVGDWKSCSDGEFLANLLLLNVNCQWLSGFNSLLKNDLVGIDVGLEDYGVGLGDVIHQLSGADSIGVLHVVVKGRVVCSVHCGRDLVAHNGDNNFIRVPILAEDCVSCNQFCAYVCARSWGNDRIVWRNGPGR